MNVLTLFRKDTRGNKKKLYHITVDNLLSEKNWSRLHALREELDRINRALREINNYDCALCVKIMNDYSPVIFNSDPDGLHFNDIARRALEESLKERKFYIMQEIKEIQNASKIICAESVNNKDDDDPDE
jgi:predicted transcriptional regulator